MKHEKSCGAIIFRNTPTQRLYLILKYAHGHWGFPKGHVEKGEDEKSTVLREISEETGISSIEILPNFREKISYSFTENNRRITKEVVFFLVQTREKDVRVSFEHRDFKWLPFDEAFEILTFENTKEMIQKAQKILN